MVKVKIWGSLQNLADGNGYVIVSGSNFKEVIDNAVAPEKTYS